MKECIKNRQLKIITDRNLYYKVKRESNEKKIKIQEYLTTLFFQKLIIIPCDFKSLEDYTKKINELGIKINYIATSTNLKKGEISLDSLNRLMYRINEYIKYLLEYEIVKLDKNIFNYKEKENTIKDKVLRFRVTEEEYIKIKNISNELEFIKLNDFFNSVLRNKIHLKINKKVLMEYLFELQKIKNNLMQIKKYNLLFNINYFLNLYKNSEERINEYINL